MPKYLKPVLLFTRLAIFYFLLPWQLMRFTKPESAKGIAAKYYHISAFPEALGLIIAVFWAALLLAFLVGLKKKISYGLVLLLHAAGVLVALPHYILYSENYNQLFLAAIPTIGAMALLFLLRREDTLLSLQGKWG